MKYLFSINMNIAVGKWIKVRWNPDLSKASLHITLSWSNGKQEEIAEMWTLLSGQATTSCPAVNYIRFVAKMYI